MTFVWLTSPERIRFVVNADHISAMAPAEQNGMDVTRIDYVDGREYCFVKESVEQILGFIVIEQANRD